MAVKLRRVRNISRTMVQVRERGLTHFLIPGQVIDNIEVENFDEINPLCEVDVETKKEDLSEVTSSPPVESGKTGSS